MILCFLEVIRTVNCIKPIKHILIITIYLIDKIAKIEESAIKFKRLLLIL